MLLNWRHTRYFLQLAKALKDLPNRVLNVPVEERAELFRNVIAVLPNPGERTSAEAAFRKQIQRQRYRLLVSRHDNRNDTKLTSKSCFQQIPQ